MIKLLPVSASEPSLIASPSGERCGSTSFSGKIHVELRHWQRRIERRTDPVVAGVVGVPAE